MDISQKSPFEQWLETNILPIIKSGTFCEPLEDISSPNPIAVDGVLDEPCWSHLEQREFLFNEVKKTPHVPAIRFVRNEDHLFLGARYDFGQEIPLEQLQGNNLQFKITLDSLLGDRDRRLTVYFQPLDDAGRSVGVAFQGCKLCRLSNNYYFASHVEHGAWTFEFSVPLLEVMAEEDRYLFYAIQFRNVIIPQECDFSFFPAVTLARRKNGSTITTSTYRNYLDLKLGE